MTKEFQLVSDFSPAGDQPQAITKLVKGINSGLLNQTLLGVTGSGKTFTVANVIQELQRPRYCYGTQQNSCRPIIRRVQRVFPE